MLGVGKKKYWSGLIMSLSFVLPLQVGLASDKKTGPRASVREVTTGVDMYDEALPACSPDGRWLAFEYNEINDPNYPRIGIMDLNKASHPWHPVLKAKQGRHLYVGDLSWSPDSRWLAVLTDYPEGRKSFWSDTTIQVVKVNIYTHEVVRLTNFPPDTPVRPTTAWLRSGLIVFSGLDENIYGVPENGGDVRKLVNVPSDKCDGVTNTLAVSPDEQRIVFEKDSGSDSQLAECNALWIADLRTRTLKRIATAGLKPLSPFWLDDDTILFSGINIDGGKWLPVGIYRLSVSTEKVTRLLDGPYLTPFVCRSEKTMYFSWGPKLRKKKQISNDGPTVNDFYGFHIWKVPLHDVLR